MDKAYNYLPNSKKSLGQMNEQVLDKWLSTSDFSKTKRNTKLKFQQLKRYWTLRTVQGRQMHLCCLCHSKIMATIAGTSAILTEFERVLFAFSGKKS